jgi:hypothetical protein
MKFDNVQNTDRAADFENKCNKLDYIYIYIEDRFREKK